MQREFLLKELELIFFQANARLTVIASIQNTSVALAGALAAVLAALAGKAIPPTWYLVFSAPFFIFGFMLLREDSILVAGDKRFYEVRRKLVQLLPDSGDRASLLSFRSCSSSAYKCVLVSRWLDPLGLASVCRISDVDPIRGERDPPCVALL